MTFKVGAYGRLEKNCFRKFSLAVSVLRFFGGSWVGLQEEGGRGHRPPKNLDKGQKRGTFFWPQLTYPPLTNIFW